MKKLMIAATAAFCGTVFGLESANVVGYQEKGLTFGDNAFVVQTFVPVGVDADKITLASISVSDDWDAAEGDFIAKLLPTGASSAEYTYLNEDYSDALGGTGAGWYFLSEVNDGDVSVSGCQNDALLPFADGFLAYNNTGAIQAANPPPGREIPSVRECASSPRRPSIPRTMETRR